MCFVSILKVLWYLQGWGRRNSVGTGYLDNYQEGTPLNFCGLGQSSLSFGCYTVPNVVPLEPWPMETLRRRVEEKP